jgi:hypothetical protein
MPSAADFLPKPTTLPALRKAAAGCRGCDLYEDATQTVFGEGPEEAGLVRDDIYVTNVVKHFKHVMRGKRRIHKKPDLEEIRAGDPRANLPGDPAERRVRGLAARSSRHRDGAPVVDPSVAHRRRATVGVRYLPGGSSTRRSRRADLPPITPPMMSAAIGGGCEP